MADTTDPKNSIPSPASQQHELFLLGGIAAVIRWLEELINLLAGPLLTIGLGIALVDLLTDGALLTSQPELLYAWAISQAVGVDAQLVAAWDRARMALRERRWLALVGLIPLGMVLAYVSWVAAQVFALQQSEGITTAAALQRLSMDPAAWLVQRTLLSVFLVCLSGWTRYHPPAKHKRSLEDERAELERELTLEPLRQQVRAQKATGVAALARQTIAAARGASGDTPKPPTGPGTPSVRTGGRSQPADDEPPMAAEEEAPTPPVLQPVRTGRRTAASRAAEEKRLRRSRDRFIAAQLEADPTIATRELVRRLRRAEHSRVSESTVSEIRHVVEERINRANGDQLAQ